MKNLQNLVGKRILMVSGNGRIYNQATQVDEYKILEISPSGNWVKVMDKFGSKIWKTSSDIQPIEILAEFEKRPTN